MVKWLAIGAIGATYITFACIVGYCVYCRLRHDKAAPIDAWLTTLIRRRRMHNYFEQMLINEAKRTEKD
jgi:hypothetical protein